MSQNTWSDTRGPHWFDNIARNEMLLMENEHGTFTTPMSGSRHVTAHKDARIFGRIGAVASYDINKIIEGEGFIGKIERT
jgi:hypothetical protein